MQRNDGSEGPTIVWRADAEVVSAREMIVARHPTLLSTTCNSIEDAAAFKIAESRTGSSTSMENCASIVLGMGSILSRWRRHRSR